MKVLHVTGENAATGRTGENGGYGDMTPPRSLGRYAPAVRLRRALPTLTQQTHTLSTESGDNASQNMCAKKRKDEKAAPQALFP